MKKILLLFILIMAAPVLRPVQASPAASIELTEAQAVEIRVIHGGLEFHNRADKPIHVHIYSITGQKVKSFEMASGSVIVELPQGCYIVKHPYGTQKVVVR